MWLQRSFNSHRHYVQGVTWDPLGEHILTQSTDRTMRVHRARASKKRARATGSDLLAASDFVQASSVSKRALVSTEAAVASQATRSSPGKQGGGCRQPADASATDPPAATAQSSQAVDAAQPRSAHVSQNNTSRSTYIFQDECLNTFFRRLSFSPEGSFVVAPAATMGPLAQVPQCAPFQLCVHVCAAVMMLPSAAPHVHYHSSGRCSTP